MNKHQAITEAYLQNNWREIRKARKAKAGVSPFRVWLTGFIWGVVTLAVMSGLTYLAWRALVN